MSELLLQLFIFLVAAAIAVPLANKLGLGSVLGYLFAGVIIGPFGLRLIGQVEEVMHLTEFGVVMMLFLVGLELEPKKLWELRTPIIGIGGLQVIITAVVIALVSAIYIPIEQAVALGLIIALSSTTLILQTLKEKNLINTNTGQSVFSVLLFQDIAVVPILAVLPLLSTLKVDHSDYHDAVFNISALPAHAQFLVTVLAIVSIFFIGKYLVRPIFRIIAKTGVREIFVAAALALIVGISLLMDLVGLSQALGAFLAGVVLANSEYKHELESDIEPFKGLLLGVFFITVGASINFITISEKVLLIASLTIALIVLKAIILYIISYVFKMDKRQKILFTLLLAQGGEFAFVLFQFTKTNGVLPLNITEPMTSVVAISMFLTPLLFKLYESIKSNRQTIVEDEKESDSIEASGQKVILAGFGRLGTDLGRFLLSSGVKPVILDNDPNNIDVLRKFGFEVYYGDITRLDLLESAGAGEAELLIVSIGDLQTSLKLIELAKKHYPHLKIVVNAHDRFSQYKLMDLHVDRVRRETFGSALLLGRDALELLGFNNYQAYRFMRLFNKNDEDMVPILYEHYLEGEELYINSYQQHMTNLEEIIGLDIKNDLSEADNAWNSNDPEK